LRIFDFVGYFSKGVFHECFLCCQVFAARPDPKDSSGSCEFSAVLVSDFFVRDFLSQSAKLIE